MKLGNCVGLNSVCKQMCCSQTGRNAAMDAIEIIEKNSRFTKEHSSENVTSFLKPVQQV